MLRVLLFRLGDDRQWDVNLGDHLVMDGLSFTAALREVLVAYVTLANGQLPALSPPRQPRDHTEAVNALLAPLKAQGGPWETPYPDDGFRLRPDPSCSGGTDPAGGRTIVALGSTAAIDGVSAQLGVLIDQQFFGEKRVARVFMQRNGEVFDQHLRICSIGQSGQESDCKDSLILDKVVPGSLY
jgi:hypothetical protein